jgi:phosphoserine/homoserine phosphotransferase
MIPKGKAQFVQLRRKLIMNIVCLDLEGVLVPEIWIAFSQNTGIPELSRTTRDEPDYDKLMKFRIGILKEHGLGLKEIQDTIATIDPMEGAKEFLDELRSFTQVIIISDTFTEFAMPLMEKLGWPTLFCNSLEVAPSGEITGYKMRIRQSKLSTVKALQSIGFDTIASGDSYNDLDMILASKAGYLFRTTEKIKQDYPQLPAFEEFDELMGAIKKEMGIIK